MYRATENDREVTKNDEHVELTLSKNIHTIGFYISMSFIYIDNIRGLIDNKKFVELCAYSYAFYYI